MKWKMAKYHQNNIKFISIYPSNMSNLDWIFRAKFREAAGYNLPTRIIAAVPSKHCTKCGTTIFISSTFCQSCGNRVAG